MKTGIAGSYEEVVDSWALLIMSTTKHVSNFFNFKVLYQDLFRQFRSRKHELEVGDLRNIRCMINPGLEGNLPEIFDGTRVTPPRHWPKVSSFINLLSLVIFCYCRCGTKLSCTSISISIPMYYYIITSVSRINTKGDRIWT